MSDIPPASGSPMPLAVRLISRHSSELALSAQELIQRLLPKEGDAAIVALAILRTCLPDWIDRDGLKAPPTLVCAALVRSTAASLGHPASTVHRLIGKLRQSGLIVSVGAGYAIGNDARWAPVVLQLLAEAHDIFLRFIEELRDAGQLDMSVHVVAREPPLLAIMSSALDLILMPFEVFQAEIGDWTSKKLWLVLSTLCVRHITTDPVLNARYAAVSTPNSERRPVPSAVLCDLAGISTATGWRHCKALEVAGIIRRDERGWILWAEELLETRIEAAVQGAVVFYRRRIAELMARGFDPNRLAYLRDRPPLVTYVPLPAARSVTDRA